MDRAFIRVSPENLITVALLSGVAYLGVYGATMLAAAVKSRASTVVAAAAPATG